MRRFAQLLSAMVYQNIIIIIAVGFIRVIFGDYGWFYNETIIQIVNPVYHTILPVLIGYTGGKLVGGQRGAVAAATAVFGLTLSSSVPAILGAMIIGPLTGWVIKQMNKAIVKRLPGAGYELLIGNILTALTAFILTLLSFLYVGKVFSLGMEFVLQLLESVVQSSWLPVVSVLVEPAKVLFFNNIVNFGILAPLGIHQVNELGKSVFFLIESNPGPGLGLLLAYWIRTKGEQRKGAKLAVTVHFFGGIHEVYFPYVLMRPRLVVPLIIGGVSGVIWFQLFKLGLVAISSPGSIFLVVGLAPKEDMLYVFLGVLLSAGTSFLASLVLLKNTSASPSVHDTKETIHAFYRLTEGSKLPEMTKEVPQSAVDDSDIKPVQPIPDAGSIHAICFVCEAGIGSSAMGAAMLRKKLRQAGLAVSVENASIHDISDDADLIICHERLVPAVRQAVPDKSCYALSTFTDMKVYDQLIRDIS